MAEMRAQDLDEVKGALRVIESKIQSVQQSAVALDTDFDQIREKFHEMDKNSAVLTGTVKILADNMTSLADAVTILKTTADRWHGVVIAALFIGPVLSGIATIALRYWLFGHPVSTGGGIIH